MQKLVTCPCQHCSGKIEFDPANLSEETKKITCPHCSLETILFLPPPPDAKIKAILSVPFMPPQPTKSEFDRVRGVADNFASASRVVVLLSFLPAGWGLLAGILGNTEGFLFFGVGASGIGLALWLYLTAQIIYIRAALEKQRE
jgi:DNA-directed RNA polymerase subunit RPC12/RpoP